MKSVKISIFWKDELIRTFEDRRDLIGYIISELKDWLCTYYIQLSEVQIEFAKPTDRLNKNDNQNEYHMRYWANDPKYSY